MGACPVGSGCVRCSPLAGAMSAFLTVPIPGARSHPCGWSSRLPVFGRRSRCRVTEPTACLFHFWHVPWPPLAPGTYAACLGRLSQAPGVEPGGRWALLSCWNPVADRPRGEPLGILGIEPGRCSCLAGTESSRSRFLSQLGSGFPLCRLEDCPERSALIPCGLRGVGAFAGLTLVPGPRPGWPDNEKSTGRRFLSQHRSCQQTVKILPSLCPPSLPQRAKP
jgi:hypothetical protein